MRQLLLVFVAAIGFLTACDTVPDYRGDRMTAGQDSNEMNRMNSRLTGDRFEP